jgi:glycosyltransferase involved in cell wall biosynthesis
MVSDADRDTLAALAPQARLTVVPNGVDTESFRPQPGADNGLVCVGGVHGFANRDALEFFAADILPLIPGAGRTMPVRWIGRATGREQDQYRSRFGIELTGYVPDARPYIRDAACYIVPIRVGGGTRVKILDAWAMGKALVTTSVGCEGLDARDGENALIRDTPEGFAGAVRTVLTDTALRRRLEAGARQTAEETYGWSRLGERMHASYAAVMHGARECVDAGTTAS